MRHRHEFIFIVSALLFFGTSEVVAEDDLPVPADEFVYCTTCHGIQLMGNPIIKAPRLSGMDAWTIEQQLQSFKKGWRGAHDGDAAGMEMQPMAAALSNEQIREAAEFVSATRSAMPATTVTGNVERGRALYGTCGACHGLSGEGTPAMGSPSLTVVDDWYLVTQLKNYKSGNRGNHSGDTYGMQMRASAQLLSDDEAIMDVVSYINTLRK